MALSGFRRTGVALVVLLAAPAVDSAQRPAASSIQLESVKSLACSFPVSALAGWIGVEPQVRVAPAGRLTLTISDIDLEDDSAAIDGSHGRSIANVKLSGSNLFFLDLRPDGSAFVTTVFAQESHDHRLKAAYAQTAPDVAQHYGDCEIRP